MAPCMSSILALSVSDKIDQYGAYAGFASVVGLAVLSLLYFAQAREVKRLREWAGRAPERAVDLQERAAAAAQQQRVVAPRPVPAPPGTPVTPAAPGARPAAATPAGQAQAVPGAAAAAAATAAGAATATPPGAAAAPGQATSVQPAANGAPAATPSVPPGQPLRVGGGTGVPPRTPAVPADSDGGDRSPLAIAGAVGAIAIVAVAAVLLATGAFSGDGDSTQPKNTIGTPGASATETTTTKSSGSSSTTSTATPKPGSYIVSVLNGTAVPGLARGVAIRLQNAKFKIGNVTNASDQTRSATQVEFAPGHRAEADTVAKAIDVAGDAIVPLTGASKTIAGDQATVVVTVGADQNTSPQQPGTTTG
jgi:hypothetical protein